MSSNTKMVSGESKVVRATTKTAGSGKTPSQSRGTLVDIQDMHPSDVLTLKRRVEAANMRITAACTDLRAAQYGQFQPEATFSQYAELEREIAVAKELIFKPE